MRPLVSVIIPVYNSDLYIRECLYSIVNQFYHPIEVIVIDDGSKEQSGGILDELASRDDRVLVIHKKNEGVSAARNTGIDYARGAYLTFVDADDFVSQTFLEQAVDAIARSSSEIVLGNTVRVSSTSKPREKQTTADTDRAPISQEKICQINDIDLVRKKVLGNSREAGNPLNGVFTSGPVCKLFKREAIGAHRFCRELRIGEDTVFNLEVLDDVSSFAYVDSDWYFYRSNDSSATRHYHPEAFEDSTKLLVRLHAFAEKHGREYVPYIQERMIQQLTGLLTSYVFHSKNKIKFREKVKLAESMIQTPPWQGIIQSKSTKKLPGNVFDKILMVLCIHNLPVLICCWTMLRMMLLKLRK